jgi:hypothetical protein
MSDYPKIVNKFTGIGEPGQTGRNVIQAPPGWPKLHREALIGLAGDVIKTIGPETEADRVALLVTFLTMFGTAAGRSPQFFVGGARHRAQLWAILVGDTSRARKGQSFSEIRHLFCGYAQPSFSHNILEGLSTGEGLLASLADGPVDRLVYETEFSRPLQVARREGNTLSPILRGLWDSGHASVHTKKDPIEIEDSMVTFTTHITEAELQRQLKSIDIANGFANRYMLFRVRRARILPGGGSISHATYAKLGEKIAERLALARKIGTMGRSEEAERAWHDIYMTLPEEIEELSSALLARDSAHLLRLSMVYALLDGSEVISVEHVHAAKAVWDFASASTRQLFSHGTGNATADKLMIHLLKAGTRGLSREEQRKALGHNVPAATLDEAEKVLLDLELVKPFREKTAGRPRVGLVAVTDE